MFWGQIKRCGKGTRVFDLGKRLRTCIAVAPETTIFS